MVLLTQLNRKLEERADKRPNPSDSKDTGQIEQDCDVWIGLYRDAVYNENADPNLMEMLLRLNREGPSGTAYALMKMAQLLISAMRRFIALPTTAQKKINVIPVAIILAQMNFNHA